jgi:hypothetical protein
MFWNKIFWLFFVVTQIVLIFSLYLSFNFENMSMSFLVFLLGVWKLFEDMKIREDAKRRSQIKVNRKLLNKLK